MARARRRKERSVVTRIQHQMVHDVAEEYRVAELPRSTRAVAAEDEGPLARAYENRHRAGGGLR